MNTIVLLTVILFLSLVPRQADAQSKLPCNEDETYYGIRHCIDDDGKTHLLLVDLTDPYIQVQTVLSVNPTTHEECNSVNPADKDPDPNNNCAWPYPFESVKSMLERYKSQGAVAVINTDYFGSNCKPRCQDHGAQGLTIKNGVRIDGSPHGAYNDHAYNSPSLAISSLKSATISIPGSEDQIKQYQQTTYYNSVGGAPIIVSGGQSVGDAACSPTKYPGNTCSDPNQSAVGLIDDRHLVLITAQKGATGVADYLSQKYHVQTAMKFDGGTSASMAWLDSAGMIQTYDPMPSGVELPPVAEGLLIFSRRKSLDVPIDSRIIELPEYSVLKPQESKVIQFTIQNTGSSAWSKESITFIRVDGQRLNLESNPPEEVRSGAVLQWGLDLKAPLVPGAYNSVWQMAHNGKPFGERIHIIVVVVPKGSDATFADQIRAMLDESLQKLKDNFDATWEDLKHQIEARIRQELWREFQQLIKTTCGITPTALVLTGGIVWWRRKRR